MTTNNIKHLLASCLLGCATCATLVSCNDWLEVYPENVQPTDKYWASKEDVEATLFSGYLYLRQSVTDYLIPWGEFRAGCVYNRRSASSALQQFQIKPTTSEATWAPMYKIVNTANLVLKNASNAFDNDDTYTQSEMNSHICEAYWLRAMAYFYIVRNWRDAPLITSPFETDDVSYNVPQSSEEDIIAQIKADLKTAIQMDAAKEAFNTTWETKGRATKWAIYALMADVCLWHQDFDEAISYADMILNSSSSSRPTFMSKASRNTWFSIFNPGNSVESIYEVQWSSEMSDGTTSGKQTNNLPYYYMANQFGKNTGSLDDRHQFLYSQTMKNMFNSELTSIIDQDNTFDFESEASLDKTVRTLNGGYAVDPGIDVSGYLSTVNAYVWKYIGGPTRSNPRTETNYDPNFIIYRVADVMLIKAEALIMRNHGGSDQDNAEAMAIVNQIRQRSNLPLITIYSGMDFSTLLNDVLHERIMELAAEGKIWYDFIRMGRYTDPTGQINFKEQFLIDNVTNFNDQATRNWITAVLSDENAWFLPVHDTEMSTNPLLKQNPYYE